MNKNPIISCPTPAPNPENFVHQKHTNDVGESPVLWLSNSTHDWKVVGSNLIQC